MFVSVMGRFRNKQASLVPSITRLTHVQHTVGLVEDKVRNPLEVGVALFEVVNETSRSGDDDLNTRPQVSNLPRLGHSAVNNGIFDVGRGAKFVALFLDLDGN